MARESRRSTKKKLLEELSRYKEAYYRDSLLRKHIKQELDQANYTMKEMISILESVSKNSFVIKPKKIFGTEDRNYLDIAILDEITLSPFIENSQTERAFFKKVNLSAINAFVEENKSLFQKAVHVEYCGKGRVSYMMSDEAFMNMPVEVLADRLSEILARELIKLRQR